MTRPAIVAEPSVSSEASEASTDPAARVVALYLPQFHPVPENDEWWGPGFSEWTNVAAARPLFRGHRQPKVPADLGYFDLRVPEVRARQADLAARHGVEAFCYWHYWFAGRRMLERPFAEVLASGEPRFGFCLGWANQTWTTIWTGDKRTVLIPQTYPGPLDHERHFHEVLPAFMDPRYFRVDGRPLFLVYRPGDLPDSRAFADQWRALAAQAGLPGLYLVGERKSQWRAAEGGFDADTLPGIYDVAPRPRLPGRVGAFLDRRPRRRPNIAQYTDLVARARTRSRLPHPELPAVVSSWDNTPRSGRRGLVVEGSTPERFGAAVGDAVEAVQDLPAQQRIVIVKSWNEWAEGNYIEPDLEHGHAYLRALADAVVAGPGLAAGRGRT
jgi:lipopolysaccharide biosynthesis protein